MGIIRNGAHCNVCCIARFDIVTLARYYHQQHRLDWVQTEHSHCVLPSDRTLRMSMLHVKMLKLSPVNLWPPIGYFRCSNRCSRKSLTCETSWQMRPLQLLFGLTSQEFGFGCKFDPAAVSGTLRLQTWRRPRVSLNKRSMTSVQEEVILPYFDMIEFKHVHKHFIMKDHDSLCAHKSLKLVIEQDIGFSVYLSAVAIAMSTAGPCWDPVVVRTAPASRADLFQSPVAPLKLPKDLNVYHTGF